VDKNSLFGKVIVNICLSNKYNGKIKIELGFYSSIFIKFTEFGKISEIISLIFPKRCIFAA
jgi:hypothetical protein